MFHPTRDLRARFAPRARQLVRAGLSVKRSLLTSCFTVFLVGAMTEDAFAQSAPDPPYEETGAPYVETAAPPVDDLAKAADAAAAAKTVPAQHPGDVPGAVDATADVASVPAPATKPSSDAIDLSALGLEPGSSTFDDKLNIYGFADVGFSAAHWTKAVPFVARDTKTFLVGNLNIYLAKNLTPKARALAEVRFTFLPNGSMNADGSQVDTTALDLANYGRPVQWGGIVIERAYVEYDLTEHLTIRGGHWLTPYGIWNIDHGSPAIVSIDPPYIIGEQFFPEHQTGLDLFGSHYQDGFKLNYHLTASNGRGATEAQVDQDSKLAFGARLDVETAWGLKVGGSYYRGRYTGVATMAGATPETYLEAAYGGDVQFDRGALHLQAEAIARERHHADGGRAAGASATGFTPDSRDLGFYALASYRLEHLWSVTPFYYHEDYRPSVHTYFSSVNFDENVGLNLRPSPNLVFKLQGSYIEFADGAGLLAGLGVYEYAAQASWMF